jgi:hypothetical protein
LATWQRLSAITAVRLLAAGPALAADDVSVLKDAKPRKQEVAPSPLDLRSLEQRLRDTKTIGVSG